MIKNKTKDRCLRQDLGLTGISDTWPDSDRGTNKVVDEITEDPEYLTKKFEPSFVKSLERKCKSVYIKGEEWDGCGSRRSGSTTI